MPSPDCHTEVGIGLRHPHYQALMAQRPDLGFVEVHSENFMVEGGAALAVLRQVRECYPISLHGVGLSLGSATGLDAEHLAQLARLVKLTDPIRISDHASFARAPSAAHGMVHANDLLPVAFTEASLDIMVRNIEHVQTTLRRPILVENLSAYLSFSDADMSEPEFLTQMCSRSGCGLVLDLNNLVVNGMNLHHHDMAAATTYARHFMRALPQGIVGEIHLAGFHVPASNQQLVIDDHSCAVYPELWQLYREALQQFGPTPTLIEWDTQLPALEVLLQEAQRAQQIARS